MNRVEIKNKLNELGIKFGPYSKTETLFELLKSRIDIEKLPELIKEIEEKEELKEETESTKLEELSKKVEMLVDVIGTIAEKVMGVEVKSVESDIKDSTPIKNDDLSLIIPSSWRRIITSLLGENFSAKIEDSGGNFILFVYLPPELDRRIGDEKTSTPDYSTGLIRRASADSDVEYWCEKIKANIKKTHPEFKN